MCKVKREVDRGLRLCYPLSSRKLNPPTRLPLGTHGPELKINERYGFIACHPGIMACGQMRFLQGLLSSSAPSPVRWLSLRSGQQRTSSQQHRGSLTTSSGSVHTFSSTFGLARPFFNEAPVFTAFLAAGLPFFISLVFMAIPPDVCPVPNSKQCTV